MTIYLQLPFTNTLYNNDGPNANLTGDYVINFKTEKRYKFQRRDQTEVKYAKFKPDNYRWVYSVIDPKTFHIYQGG